MNVLKETNFDSLGKKRTGKVRDMYEQPDRLILITTDRHSSFDRIIAHIPWKGQVLNQISAWWFEKTKDIVPNHILAIPDPNVTVGRKCKMWPIEVVPRGFISGSTNTSLWTLYSSGQRDFGNFTLPDGMKKNERLPEPVLTPTTKSEEHDRPISLQEIVAEGFATKEKWDEIARVSIALFERGQQVARERGLILVDTKYEFGYDQNGTLTLIDEIHTPDSSRYWQADSYQARIDEGKEPEYFDKEFLRLWFREHCDPYKDAVLPEAPPDMVKELSARYIQMYEQITGEKFTKGETPVLPRMERNLAPYAV